MKRYRNLSILLLLLLLGLVLPLSATSPGEETDLDAAAEAVANEIAADSGRPAREFRAYAVRLVATLDRLSPEARYRVLGTHAARVGLGDTTDPGGSPGGTPDGSPDPDGSTSGAGANTPPDDPVVDGPLIDLLNGVPWTPPGALTDALLDASPLSEAVLAELIVADDVMAPAGTTDILLVNMPLPASVYNSIVAGESDLFGSQIQSIVDAQAAATAPPAP